MITLTANVRGNAEYEESHSTRFSAATENREISEDGV